MIRMVSFYMILFLINSCGQGKKIINTPPPTAEMVKAEIAKQAEMTFDFDHVDFGILTKGEKRDTTYTFTNTGSEDIIIELATACECTTLEYPKDVPIKPGDKGEIAIIFDSDEKDSAETITIDILLKNTNPKNGYPIVYQVTYDFDIAKP